MTTSAEAQEEKTVIFTGVDGCRRWQFLPPDYKTGFVETLKESIPGPDRWWEPSPGYWVVSNEWAQEASEILLDYWPDYEIVWKEE